MTSRFSSENDGKVDFVPPSPELEQRIIRTKRRFLAGETLPRDAASDILDLKSFISIINRPAHTRPHTLGVHANTALPATGERNALVILVDFDDSPAARQRQHYLDMLFSSGKYPTGSLRDYYYEASYRKLIITGDVCGGENGWLRAPKPYSYYSADSYGFGEYPKNAARLVEDAIDLAAEYVDFADYDVDGDGEVDALFIVHAGQGAEVTGILGHIWSHMSNITPKKVDGVMVSRYSMEPEDGNIGVFCHELGHVFGLPDLYDYDMDSAGTGCWDLMAGGCWNNGGLTPAHPLGWCKTRLGWVQPVPLFGHQESITLRPSILFPEIYRLPADGSEEGKEYFLIENRRRTGFDSCLPGEGLMIQHVDETQRNNNDQGHYLVDVEQCDGRCDLNRNANHGDEEDPFPTKSCCSFSSGTKPSSKRYSGECSRVALKNIRCLGENIIVDISVGGEFGAMPQCGRRITAAFGNSSSRWMWIHISGMGWRRIKENTSSEDAGIISLCRQAAAKKRKGRAHADGCVLYSISPI